MFNKYYNIGGGTKHVYSKTEVTEKRAPTDDSVKLLREMEAKAMDSIMTGFLSGNSVEVVGLSTSPAGFGDPTWHYAFKINGKLYRGRLDGPSQYDVAYDKFEAFRKVLGRMAEVITEQLFVDNVTSLDTWK